MSRLQVRGTLGVGLTIFPSDNTNVQKSNTGIVDLGASDIYFAPDAPTTNFTHTSTHITVGTATGQTQNSSITAALNLAHPSSDFPQTGHVMPGFKHKIIEIGPLCNDKSTVTFNTDTVIFCDRRVTAIITGWQETDGARLYRVALFPSEDNVPLLPPEAQ